MTIDVRGLRSRFDRAAPAAGATSASDAVFEELVARYGEPHRHYHTLAHIDACLAWLDWFWSLAEHPEEVELALWFHDAVHAPGASDNERQSARLARDRLGATGIDAARVERIARHIEATERHAPCAGDGALVVDLDLTVLGAPPQDFDRFEHDVRREYAQVPDAMYGLGRAHVLQGFLSRPQIYNSTPIRDQLEDAARANLRRRIGELSG